MVLNIKDKSTDKKLASVKRLWFS